MQKDRDGSRQERMEELRAAFRRNARREKRLVIAAIAVVAGAVAVDFVVRTVLAAPEGSPQKTLRTVIVLAAAALAVLFGLLSGRLAARNRTLEDEYQALEKERWAQEDRERAAGSWRPRAQRKWDTGQKEEGQ